jgi:myxalamid-type polyketide synthase MxaB
LKELRDATQGKGVDVVLNSLAGPLIDAGLEVLAPGGRFIELGVADLRSVDWVTTVRPDVTYHTVNLATEIETASIGTQQIIAALVEQFQSGELKPLPREIFRFDQIQDAFHYMAQARHIGRVVVSPQGQTMTPDIRKDGSYLVTGGTSGLGLKVAEWLAVRGAGEVIVMGRNLPSAEAAKVFEDMRAAGTAVTVRQGDVAMEADAAAALHSNLPLRGIFHSAGILDDGALLQQNWERFQRVLAPKVDGSRHLHRLSQDYPLDHFVLFSSMSGLFGSPGQTNYASANTFLDALACFRRLRNLPALSIDWGAWSETGLAARNGVVERSSRKGILGMSTQDGLSALEALQTGNVGPQWMVGPVNWTQYFLNDLPAGQRLFLSGLQVTGQPPKPGERSHSKHVSWLPQLQIIAKSRWRELLTKLVEERIRVILRLDRSQTVIADQPLQELGLDSLLSIELRNSLGLSINRTLPATLLFNYPTLDALTEFLARELGAEVATKAAVPKVKSNRKNLVDNIEALSDEEVDLMLGEKAMRGAQ